jgi:hypothetical protein
MHIPSREEFVKGCEEFQRHEKREAMYKVATFLVSHFWGKPAEMADGLGVLLLTWNQAFYRYGVFDFDKLQQCTSDNLQHLTTFRDRHILSLSDQDEMGIKELFHRFLQALEIESGKGQARRSPVAVAKALHLLAPDFFPLWDNTIARVYGCRYGSRPAEQYVTFCGIVRSMAEVVKDYKASPDRTLIKLIDEYNYSKYTKRWV